MADVTIVKGDSYALRRPLFTHTFVDDVGAPFSLAGCTVRSTFKTATTDPSTDTTDSTAVIKATLVVSGLGVATSETKMYLVGPATDGVCELRLSASDTLALTTGTFWLSDVELTDGNGEVFTFLYSDRLTAVNGYTNRTSG